MFLLSWSNRLLSFVVAREHFRLSAITHGILTWLRCVPVTRGGQDACAARTALRRLREDCVLCIFPEGNLSGVARNHLRPGRAGVALLALRSRVPVFPVYIAGGPRTIKLLRSWLFPSPEPVQVVYGPRVDLSAYYGHPINRKTLEEVTAYIMRHVAALDPQRRAKKAEKRIPNQEVTMTAATAQELTRKHCAPCEGGVPPLSPNQVQELLREVPNWKLSPDGQRIQREWRVKNFVIALDFFNRVGQVAEDEGHHPDLHLVGYRNVTIEIWTHAIGGLSENDFILAAKIDTLPVELKK
jgi:4a-hydroxytetrahydrobiopterin dehydratase